MDGKRFLNDFEFDNDFGRSPMGLGLLLKDSGLVGLATVVLTVLALPVGGSLGVPLALAVAYLGANDCKALGRKGTDTPLFQPSPEPNPRPPAAPQALGATPTSSPEQRHVVDTTWKVRSFDYLGQ